MTVRSAALLLSAAIALALPGPGRAQGVAGPYLAGSQASYRDDYTAAAQYFTDAVASDPANAFLLQNAIVNNVVADRFDLAVPLARKLGTLDEDRQIGDLVLVADALRKSDFTAAAKVIGDPAGGFNPLLAGLLRGWIAAGQNDIAAAQAAFDALSTQATLDGLGQYHKALVLALAGDFEGAERIFAGKDGTPLRVNRAAIAAHAQVLMQLDRRDDALKVLDDAVAETPERLLVELRDRIASGADVPFDYVASPLDGAGEVFLTMATALNQEDAGRFALLYARLAQVVRPGYVDALMLSADIFDAEDQHDLAIADYTRVPDTSPEYRNALIGKANALNASGDAAQGILVLKDLTAARPDDQYALISLGDMQRQQDDCASAVTSYTAAIALITAEDPEDWRNYYVRGICHEQLDDWPNAEADFRHALNLQPDQPLVLNYLGYSMVEKNIGIDEARDMIERAVAGEPDNGYITDSLGWVLYRTGQYQDAVPHMERAVELLPTDPIINDHLGDVLWMVGRKTEASFQWRRALSFEPEDPKDAERIRRKLDIGLDEVLKSENTATTTSN